MSASSDNDLTLAMCHVQSDIMHVYVASERQTASVGWQPNPVHKELCRLIEAQLSCLLQADSGTCLITYVVVEPTNIVI